jgi:hypothetical protein
MLISIGEAYLIAGIRPVVKVVMVYGGACTRVIAIYSCFEKTQYDAFPLEMFLAHLQALHIHARVAFTDATPTLALHSSLFTVSF